MAEKSAIQKMPLAKLKGYFKNSEKNYTDEQLLSIRDFLYEWAETNYNIYKTVLEKEAHYKKIFEEQELNNST